MKWRLNNLRNDGKELCGRDVRGYGGERGENIIKYSIMWRIEREYKRK